ncbi:23S rRNA (adenine(2030)-N(6))-methyltransferase RlmJ [Salipiger sp. P9]|uniref:23S rRNA (adenine(2030)-N(6))-methyltransferase RlmJ n=1 Tax=Salipiger pentaromativorans TaxID=2943193 RepID=UPI002157694C|nr:23S rRNA (adenine(2030)-N(6))-methyltransferase RlmJ [Salipiger pentaromativorans]MCR8549865.1 23S rRNA (adenine(2030)-N(6))-methyltransferase RlmJ [Salipiger pentaromativorans]
MLSYQHGYHAGNLADVQKHALLAWMLAYLTRKDKPLSYIETHAGRGLYDLGSAEAQKTGEAAQGIGALAGALPPGHPYAKALATIRAQHGPAAYPGSPLIAATLLRPQDRLHLAELHPQEHAALRQAVQGPNISVHRQDGFELAQSLCPPEPRRGLLLVDPSYEVKQDYDRIPKALGTIAKKWNVGILALWYPILTSELHAPMLRALTQAHPEALRHEIRFPPVREGHRMIGSGFFVINPPWGLSEEAKRLDSLFARIKKR